MIDDSGKEKLLRAMESYERAVREAMFAAEERAEGRIGPEDYQESVRKLDGARLHLRDVRVSLFGIA